MKNIVKASIVASLAIGLGFSQFAHGNADGVCIPSEAVPAWVETITISEAVEAWTEEVVVSEEYPLYEYKHAQNEDHPDSPRWEVEGWNGNSFNDPDADKTVSWYYTGNTKIVPEVIEVIEHEAIPAVTEEIEHEAIPAVVCEEKKVIKEDDGGYKGIRSPLTGIGPKGA